MVAVFASVVNAQTVVVRLDAEADTTVRRNRPAQAFGGRARLDAQGGAVRRALVRFDEAALEDALAQGTLRSAVLEFSVTRVELPVLRLFLPIGRRGRWLEIPLPLRVDAHRLTESWSESEATWLFPGGRPVHPWFGPPVWFMGIPRRWPFERRASDRVQLTGSVGALQFDVTQDLARGADDGWLVRVDSELLDGGVRLRSRESARPPQLVLTLSVPDTTPPEVEWSEDDGA